MDVKGKLPVIKRVVLVAYFVGLTVFWVSSVFRARLTDFELGFCEGISITGILMGCAYFGWCFAKRKNPFIV